VRRLVARHPWLRGLAILTLAACVGGSVLAAMARVERERESWGTSTTVVVAARDVAPGETMSGATVAREAPLALAPPTAVHTLAPSATATQRIAAGEIVVESDVVRVGGPLALLPAGWLAVTVPDSTGGSALESGALFRPGDPATVLADGAVIAADAVVVAVAAQSIVVGVPAADAARVAQAANQRAAVVALGSGS
jgi:hypothetical protein